MGITAAVRVRAVALGASALALLATASLVGGLAAAAPGADWVTLSIVGTSDLHGAIFERQGRGGLALLGGYVKNLRQARAADGGAVLLVDAGDTYQGGIESNLSEGGVVVDAYNAMGYAAAAIGNHEFDFGPTDEAGRRRSAADDPRGALKAIAARARFPVLAANLVDESTGRVVNWPNVSPSTIVETGGLKVGLIGVMTINALRATLVVNTHGLRVTPLAPAIEAEAVRLRAAGVDVVVVAAHAGGSCERFDRPTDLSSCQASSEIFEVARALPVGLVDVIVAGHAHAGLAHRVNGIAITESFAGGRAFGRVDVNIDRVSRAVASVEIFAPHEVCAREDPATHACLTETGGRGRAPAATYEGRAVVPDAAVHAAMAPALHSVRELQATHLGVKVDAEVRRADGQESPLGNLFADALRAAVPGADFAMTNGNGRGGLRADLPPGPLTFGLLYDVFPFDNQIARLHLTGDQLVRALRGEILRPRRGALGVSGMLVRARCAAGRLSVDVRRASGHAIGAAETLLVATTDMLASGAAFRSVGPPEGFALTYAAPVAREVVSDWLQRRRDVAAHQFASPAQRRWDVPATVADCAEQSPLR